MRVLALILNVLIPMATNLAQAALGDGLHIAQNAETLKQWQWSFKPSPGVNPTGSTPGFAMNSLSIGITNNIEIGTIPFAWNQSQNPGSKTKMSNYNIRRVFYRNQYWTVSTGVTWVNIISELKSDPSSSYSYYGSSDMDIVSFVLANSYVINSDWRITHNLAYRVIRGETDFTFIDKNNGTINHNRTPFTSENYFDHYLDLSYTKSITNVWAIGLSRATDHILGISIGTRAVWGIGVSHTWNLQKSYLSQLSMGLHLMDDQSSKLLFGMAF